MAFAPLLGSAALSFAPALLQRLFFGDPHQKLRQQAGHIQSPANRARLAAQHTQRIRGSAAFSEAQGNIASGANQAQSQIAGALQARGVGTSGSGAVKGGLVPSLVGKQQAGLNTQAGTLGEQGAEQDIQRQLAQLFGTSGPSQSQQLFAGGLEAFGPLLQKFLAAKFPGMFGGAGAGAPVSVGAGTGV